jgi:hypothetical protein
MDPDSTINIDPTYFREVKWAKPENKAREAVIVKTEVGYKTAGQFTKVKEDYIVIPRPDPPFHQDEFLTETSTDIGGPSVAELPVPDMTPPVMTEAERRLVRAPIPQKLRHAHHTDVAYQEVFGFNNLGRAFQ